MCMKSAVVRFFSVGGGWLERGSYMNTSWGRRPWCSGSAQKQRLQPGGGSKGSSSKTVYSTPRWDWWTSKLSRWKQLQRARRVVQNSPEQHVEVTGGGFLSRGTVERGGEKGRQGGVISHIYRPTAVELLEQPPAVRLVAVASGSTRRKLKSSGRSHSMGGRGLRRRQQKPGHRTCFVRGSSTP